jgi:hypothetical protein
METPMSMYYIWQNDTEHGPFTEEEVKHKLRTGEIVIDAPCRREGEEWTTSYALGLRRTPTRDEQTIEFQEETPAAPLEPPSEPPSVIPILLKTFALGGPLFCILWALTGSAESLPGWIVIAVIVSSLIQSVVFCWMAKLVELLEDIADNTKKRD